jgi:probable HAF family extracellular repeat protein
MRLRLCAPLAALMSLSAASAAAALPTIDNLGTLGGTSSAGADINNSGQVTGRSNTASGASHAFLYNGTPGSGGVMHDLGTLGGTWSFGQALNNSGQVAGGSSASGNFPEHGFLYTGTPGSGGVMLAIGFAGGISSYASGVNDSGQIVGGTFSSGGDPDSTYAFFTAPGSSGLMDYHFLPSLGGNATYGRAINDSGQIVGESEYTPEHFGTHAFLHIDFIMHDLGTLGGGSSKAFAINNSGQVAGESEYTPEHFGTHAFLYTGTPGSGGVMHDLGTLGGTFSSASSINVAGDIVGWSHTAEGEAHAFVYTGTPGVDGVMIDLDAWLDANNPGEGVKWTLESANGLNDNGLITGSGIYDDGPGGLNDGARAFVLDASSLLSHPSSSADFNGDGDVDGEDLDAWSGGFGLAGGAAREDGDADGDKDVDGADFLVWQRQVSGATAIHATVPEPAAGVLALLGSTVAGLGSRRVRHMSQI